MDTRRHAGTGVGTALTWIAVERDPITTAKEVATVDRLSGGRFLFGIGGGWNAVAERRWRPSNEVWRRKLAQGRLEPDVDTSVPTFDNPAQRMRPTSQCRGRSS